MAAVNDVVIVPTYHRPELLQLCLEHLSVCPEISTKDVWVRHDNRLLIGRFVEESESVVRGFGGRLNIQFAMSQPHVDAGNSWNVLTAYKDALDAGAQRVYLVEDDVLVSPDFFTWHDAMYERHPNLFCSVGWHCLRRGPEIPRGSTDQNAYFLSTEDFASIGVAWTAPNLRAVIKHAVTEYFCGPQSYVQGHFPKNPLSAYFSEQDGLIMRVLGASNEYSRAPVAWPYLRRCHHVGYYGYHRPKAERPVGEYSDRLANARRIVSDRGLMDSKGVLFGGDTDVVVSATPWRYQDLRCVARYGYEQCNT
jgi:hypothetical protein